MRFLDRLAVLPVIAFVFCTPLFAIDAEPETDKEGWITIFDGKSLDGWEAAEKPEHWEVKDGVIKGHGDRSHLFYKKQKFSDFEFQLDCKLNKNGNSGQYFRAAFGEGWPKGYEAQLNNSHPDPKRTGSLYNFVAVPEKIIEDDTWWTQRVVAKGNHIQIFVNDKKVVDFTDEKNTYTDGYVALQQHDPGSLPEFRNLKVRPLK